MKIKSYIVKIKQNIIKYYKLNKKLFLSIVVLLIIVIGYVFYLMNSSNNSSETIVENNQTFSDVESYESRLENKLKNLLLNIDDVNLVDVMVVCDTTEIVHYLKNNSKTETTSDGSTTAIQTDEVVFEKNSSNTIPIIEYKTMPKVLGVMVVLSNVSPSTKLAIIKSIAVVLNIDESCISIILV